MELFVGIIALAAFFYFLARAISKKNAPSGGGAPDGPRENNNA